MPCAPITGSGPVGPVGPIGPVGVCNTPPGHVAHDTAIIGYTNNGSFIR